MPANLGGRTKTGAANANNPVSAGGWTVEFNPRDFSIQVEFEIYHIGVTGPTGSSFEVWIDTMFYDSVQQGYRNGWDPAQPMILRPGQTLYFHFNTSTGSAPVISVFCRQTSAI